MSDLPLQPLVWFERKDSNMYGNIKHCAQGAGIFYTIMPTSKDVEVYWGDSIDGSSGHRTLRDVADAKEWVKTDHYPSKMQPYVKPMPTWIDASERLPESECFYLVRLFDGHRDEHVFVILWWNSEHQQFLEWDAMCEPTHWMPIPEFSTMQNLHKGG